VSGTCTPLPVSDTVVLLDETRPSWASAGPRPVRVHLWRPARSEERHPAILVSHGAGGSAGQMEWLTEPLAAAGYLAIAVDHHGFADVRAQVASDAVAFFDAHLR
jgi:alpha-beta hydrolase superfamily lysophospholipase